MNNHIIEHTHHLRSQTEKMLKEWESEYKKGETQLRLLNITEENCNKIQMLP
jgi:hypothetical protein